MAMCGTCNKAPVFFPETTCGACKMKAGFALKKVVAPVNAGPQGLAPAQLPMGATLAINVRRQGSTQWTPAPATIYALQGTPIEFQVVVQGGGPAAAQVRLETAQWSGLTNGIGKTTSFGCNNTSASTAAPGVITVSFGGQSASANVLVFAINIVETFRDNFAGRSTTELGVCEEIDLSFTTTPAGITPAQLGGLRWRFKNNDPANMRQRGVFTNALGQANAPNDGTARYRAPYATHPPGTLTPAYSDVSIELCLLAGICQGKGPGKSYRIHKPVAHMTQQLGSAPHHWNQGGELPSAGFTGVFSFSPKHVSFSNIGFREGRGNMESDGVCAGDEQGVGHQPTATVFGMSTGNTATGCQLLGGVSDNIHSAASTYRPETLLTTNGGTRPVGSLSPTTRVGGKRWPITWEYTYRDIATGGWSTNFVGMQKAYHELTVYENGRATMHKGHKGCADCNASITVDYGVGAAHNWP